PRREPTVLPSRFPNLLVNGSAGIAVGMATNMPPHHLGETIDAVVAMIDDPAISVEGLMKHVKGPDFPTGAIVVGRSGIRDAYRTGRGRIVMRARAHIEELRGGRSAVVVTELPYVVTTGGDTGVIDKIAELVLEGYLIALDNIDAAVALIRAAADRDVARTGLMEQFSLSEIQAEAILEMRLSRLTGLARKEVEDEHRDLAERIAELRDILG